MEESTENPTGRASEARRRLLSAADELFYAHGINATGVEKVIEAADVARMTFYKHFGGKDGLIAAYLEGRDLRWRMTLEDAITAAGDDPYARLLAVFEALKLWSTEPRYRGCSFANAAAELADPDHPARQVVAAHKQAMRTRLTELAHQADLDNPDLVVDQILMLFEGAITNTALGTVAEAADKARATAQDLLGPQ